MTNASIDQFVNSSTGPTMEDYRSSGAVYFFYIYYPFIFLLGFFGNFLIIMSVVKFKKMRIVFNVFLVNLAIADILFVVLSLFHGIKFLHNNEWVFGDAFCKIQVTLIETSYTVSVCTLTVVAAERYMAICWPHKIKRTIAQAIKVCVSLWIFGFLFCSCLLYGAGSRINKKGTRGCSNNSWSNGSRLSFYIVHTIVVYLLPLAMMLFSHIRISKGLVDQKIKMSKLFANSTMSTNSIDRKANTSRDHRKAFQTARRIRIVRLLVVITLIFFILWTPFIIVRFLKYSGIPINNLLWRGMQLLIMGNTAANCIIYALMNRDFRNSFKLIFCCCTKNNGVNQNDMKVSMTSNSLDFHKLPSVGKS